MGSPGSGHWRDPADSAARPRPAAQSREAPCLWCGDKATLDNAWAIGGQIRLQGPICNPCAAGVASGDWMITITVMDRKRTLRGWDLDSSASGAQSDRPV